MKITRTAQKINLNNVVDISVDVHKDILCFFFEIDGREYTDECRNRTAIIERDGARLALVGLDDLLSPAAGPDFALLRHPRNAFRVCLCHQPQGWDAARAAGAHLTLSGHTHGGQIALPTRNVNPARLQTRYIAGPYHADDASLYVSRGIGVGAVPVRVGAPPEIDVITLRSTAASVGVAA